MTNTMPPLPNQFRVGMVYAHERAVVSQQEMHTYARTYAEQMTKELRADLDRVTKGSWSKELARLSAVNAELRAEVERLRLALSQMAEDYGANKLSYIPTGTRASKPEPAQEPYCYVYEYDTPFGLHRQFDPSNWNGSGPTRTVAVYTAPLSDKAKQDRVMELLDKYEELLAQCDGSKVMGPDIDSARAALEAEVRKQ
jgi:hypothetical protein